MWYNIRAVSGKQVRILHEPVAVLRKAVRTLPDVRDRGQAIGYSREGGTDALSRNTRQQIAP